MNMTPEEQRAMVQFFGTMHAQAKQTDQMIVGNSQFVKPVSPSIQQELEQALRIPVQVNQQVPQQQYIEQPPVAVIEPSQAIQELQSIQNPVDVIPPHDPVIPYTGGNANADTVIFNSDAVEVLKEISLNLARIGDILERKNGTSKRIKAPKSA